MIEAKAFRTFIGVYSLFKFNNFFIGLIAYLQSTLNNME
jgi:hypothetical protein